MLERIRFRWFNQSWWEDCRNVGQQSRGKGKAASVAGAGQGYAAIAAGKAAKVRSTEVFTILSDASDEGTRDSGTRNQSRKTSSRAERSPIEQTVQCAAAHGRAGANQGTIADTILPVLVDYNWSSDENGPPHNMGVHGSSAAAQVVREEAVQAAKSPEEGAKSDPDALSSAPRGGLQLLTIIKTCQRYKSHSLQEWTQTLILCAMQGLRACKLTGHLLLFPRFPSR